MALEVLKSPVYANSESIVGKRDLSHNLAMQDFAKPHYDEMIFQQAPDHWLNFFLKDKASVEHIKCDEFHWYEKGKIYSKSIVKSTKEIGPLEHEICFEGLVRKYACNDVIDLGCEYPGCPGVSLTAFVKEDYKDADGNWCALVEIIDPQGTAAGNVTLEVGAEVALLYNARGECFEKPKCRNSKPQEYKGSLTKISDCTSICDDAANQCTWFRLGGNGKYAKGWMGHDQQDLNWRHARAQDNALLFAQPHSFEDTEGYQGKIGMGIVPSVGFYGSVRRFAGELFEDDLKEIIQSMKPNMKGNEICLIGSCGLIAQIQSALSKYCQGGAIYYGPFNTGEGNKVGVNITKYHYLGKTISIMEYEPFSDPDFLPRNDKGVNWDNFGLLLTINKQNTTILYRKRYDGTLLRNFVDTRKGMTMGTSGGAQFTADRACAEMYLTTHIGLKMKCQQGNGMLIGS